VNRPGDATPRVAVLTPPGRGAVATIRIEAPPGLLDATEPPLFRAVAGIPVADMPVGRVVFGHWGREPAEEVVLCRTASEVMELHCHGGDAAVNRIVDDLQVAAGRLVDWVESFKGEQGEFAGELAEALSRSTTLRTAAVLLEQNQVLPATLAMLGDGRWTEAGRQDAVERLRELQRWTRFGRHLAEPWQVVFAGRPNVGKSSLVNALVGYGRSIVFDQPGTTRDVVTTEAALDGWPVRFSDTAGLREEATSVEAAGIERAVRQLADADCRVIVLDSSRPATDEDRRLFADWPEAVIAANQCDRPDAWGDELPGNAVRISAITGEGVSELAASIVTRLVPEVPEPGVAVPFTERQASLLAAAAAAIEAEDETAFRAATSAIAD